jgi:DNA-binding LytR/AlgR family response regulator
VITDDEPIAQEIIERYISLVPGLTLAGKCRNAMETYDMLLNNKVDVLFIDIQMPEISGLEFLRSLKNKPIVVFTTAYPNFAADAFNLDVTDYLLKPISIERFLKAIDRIFLKTNNNVNQPSITNLPVTPARSYFFIRSESEFIRIEYDQIIFIEGMENYVKFICEDKSVIALNTMKNTEALLPDHFLRIHRSYIVNMNKVQSVQDQNFTVKDRQIPIGKSFRKEVTDTLKKLYSF